MPLIDYKKIAIECKKIVGENNVLSEQIDRALYSCDAETLDEVSPDLVVLPGNTEETQAVVKLANKYNIPFTARGAGTGLSGGSTTICGGISIVLTRMTRIMEIDTDSRSIWVEVGITNTAVSQAVAQYNLCFAPDPSSQAASTIGGNIAENAGGAHTLKYGTTVDHVSGMKIVLPDGELIECQSGQSGLDWLALFCGSEGTLGIVTEAKLKLIPIPEKIETALLYFSTLEEGAQVVSEIIAAGIIPCAMEMIDGLTIKAVEEAFALGLNKNAEALLIIEIDGSEISVAEEKKQINEIINKHKDIQYTWALSSEERALMWKARKSAFGALGRIAPHGYVLDGVVPRPKLVEAIKGIKEIGKKYGLIIANIFHAGDGNLHPCLLYHQDNIEQTEKVLKAAYEILKLGIELGGSLSGEHGIGIEKKDAMIFSFTPADLNAMEFVKKTFDSKLLCNPGKILPNKSMCGEAGIRPLFRHKLSMTC